MPILFFFFFFFGGGGLYWGVPYYMHSMNPTLIIKASILGLFVSRLGGERRTDHRSVNCNLRTASVGQCALVTST